MKLPGDGLEAVAYFFPDMIDGWTDLTFHPDGGPKAAKYWEA
jgi:hypothetical protein